MNPTLHIPNLRPRQQVHKLTTLLVIVSLSACSADRYGGYIETDPGKFKPHITTSDNQYGTLALYLEGKGYRSVGEPPRILSVNGKVIAIMPPGSKILLHLPPNQYQITSTLPANTIFGWKFFDQSATIEVKADRLSSAGYRVQGIFYGLKADAQPIHAQSLESLDYAKIVYKDESLESFKQRLSALSHLPSQSVGIEPALTRLTPTDEQVSSFFETIAVIAFAAVGLYAVANTSKDYLVGSGNLPPQSLSFTRNNLTLAEIVRSGQRTEIYNTNTGIRYTLENGRIRGNDGTRYVVRGNSIYSDSGLLYEVIGNQMRTPDGRYCYRIGSSIQC